MSAVSVLFSCPKCGKAVCQRAFTMNLAFGHDEEQFCLNCLAAHYGQELPEFFATGLHYVNSRECFQKAWEKLQSPEECPIKEACAFGQCFQKLG
jgi:hypothetical protein